MTESVEAIDSGPGPGPVGLYERQKSAFGEMQVEKRDCPLCGDANLPTPDSRYSLGQWVIKTCRLCGFTYMTSAPVDAALVEQMSWEKSSQLEGEWRDATRGLQQKLSRKTRWRLNLLPRKTMPNLAQRHARPGNVVDLGCGDGGQLAGLPPGYVPFGVEISREAAVQADRRFSQYGGRAINAPSSEGLATFPEGYFSAATLRSYLEHEREPARVLAELHRVLAVDGVALVKVPNFGSLNRRVMGRRWCGFRHPDHLNYFTPRSLREMAARCGFSTHFRPGWRLPTSDNMWALLKRKTLAAWLCINSLLASSHGALQMAPTL